MAKIIDFLKRVRSREPENWIDVNGVRSEFSDPKKFYNHRLFKQFRKAFWNFPTSSKKFEYLESFVVAHLTASDYVDKDLKTSRIKKALSDALETHDKIREIVNKLFRAYSNGWYFLQEALVDIHDNVIDSERMEKQIEGLEKAKKDLQKEVKKQKESIQDNCSRFLDQAKIIRQLCKDLLRDRSNKVNNKGIKNWSRLILEDAKRMKKESKKLRRKKIKICRIYDTIIKKRKGEMPR